LWTETLVVHEAYLKMLDTFRILHIRVSLNYMNSQNG
jgi:hypothetical protein